MGKGDKFWLGHTDVHMSHPNSVQRRELEYVGLELTDNFLKIHLTHFKINLRNHNNA